MSTKRARTATTAPPPATPSPAKKPRGKSKKKNGKKAKKRVVVQSPASDAASSDAGAKTHVVVNQSRAEDILAQFSDNDDADSMTTSVAPSQPGRRATNTVATSVVGSDADEDEAEFESKSHPVQSVATKIKMVVRYADETGERSGEENRVRCAAMVPRSALQYVAFGTSSDSEAFLSLIAPRNGKSGVLLFTSNADSTSMLESQCLSLSEDSLYIADQEAYDATMDPIFQARQEEVDAFRAEKGKDQQVPDMDNATVMAYLPSTLEVPADAYNMRIMSRKRLVALNKSLNEWDSQEDFVCLVFRDKDLLLCTKTMSRRITKPWDTMESQCIVLAALRMRNAQGMFRMTTKAMKQLRSKDGTIEVEYSKPRVQGREGVRIIVSRVGDEPSDRESVEMLYVVNELGNVSRQEILALMEDTVEETAASLTPQRFCAAAASVQWMLLPEQGLILCNDTGMYCMYGIDCVSNDAQEQKISIIRYVLWSLDGDDI